MKGLIAGMLMIAVPMSAQQIAPAKDAGLATVLSVVVPGAGQMYAEETGKGFLMLLGAVGSIAIGSAASTKATPNIYSPGNPALGVSGATYYGSPANNTPLVIGGAVGGVIWLWSVLDAAPAVRRTNAKHSRVSLIPLHSGLALRIAL